MVALDELCLMFLIKNLPPKKKLLTPLPPAGEGGGGGGGGGGDPPPPGAQPVPFGYFQTDTAMQKSLKRCPWPTANDPLYIAYHDKEWGVPVHNDRKLYEFLVLEAFQAGLSWRTVLHKRKNFKKAFAGFDPKKVARFTNYNIRGLMQDKGIIRNKLKIEAAINNAKRFLEIQKEFGTFAKYMWSFVEGRPIDGGRINSKDLPAG